MSEKPKIQDKISTAAGAAVATYVVGKAFHDARTQRKLTRAAEAAAAEQARRDAEPAPEAPVEKPAPEREEGFGEEKSKLSSLRTYMGQYINTASSMRKILPRNKVYHAPWSYHNAPSYASLNLDQTELNDGERPYNSGLEQLTAAGKKPLHDALSRKSPDAEWGTILSGDDLRPKNEHLTKAAARDEKERLIGLWSAVEGMGFDTRDMAFAHWQERDGSRYTVVPYDTHNDLHHTAATGLATGIDLAQDPGFMLRSQGTRPGDMSLDVSIVDIDSLRSQMGSETIPPTPDARELARQEYRGVDVLPSTQPGF